MDNRQRKTERLKTEKNHDELRYATTLQITAEREGSKAEHNSPE